MSTTPTLAAIPPLCTVPEAIALLKTSRRSLYQMIGDGTLAVIKRGARTLVPGSEVARLSAPPDADQHAAARAAVKARGAAISAAKRA